MPNITEQQLTFLGQALDTIVKGLDPNDSMQTRDIVAEGNSVIRLIASIWKKGKETEQPQQQTKNQLVSGVDHLISGAAFSAHKKCCSVCSSGEVKNLLSRFIRH